MRVIERRQRTDAHELLRADLYNGDARVIVKMGYDSVRHGAAFAFSDLIGVGGTIAMNGYDS
jgi:hypothetical protein